MRILLQARSNLWSKPGGDSVQVYSLAQGLKEIDYDVEIDLSANRRLDSFDLVHCFNISRIQETYQQVLNAERQAVPYVLTPIFQNLSEYNLRGRYGIAGRFAAKLSYETAEQLRNTYLWLRKESSKTACKAIWQDGYLTAVRHVLNNASGIIYNSNSENNEIQHFFKPTRNAPSTKIPVGINLHELDEASTSFSKRIGIKNYVLCVGRIEDLKNQHRIIEALKQAPHLPLVFIGFPNPNHRRYVRKFISMVRSRRNTFWFHDLDRDSVLSAIFGAKVHILASFFETTGLANVEAAYLGASVVGTNQGYCREIFGKYANYCDPFNKDSILKATVEAWNTKQVPDTKNWIRHRFCYKICALKHANFYEKMRRDTQNMNTSNVKKIFTGKSS